MLVKISNLEEIERKHLHLKKYQNIFGFKTIITSPLKKKGITISSTLIRKKLNQGKIKEVNRLLNRPWCVEGKVIKGMKRGRKIGFPTCNIKLTHYTIPKLGVYSVIVDGNRFKKKVLQILAITNI